MNKGLIAFSAALSLALTAAAPAYAQAHANHETHQPTAKKTPAKQQASQKQAAPKKAAATNKQSVSPKPSTKQSRNSFNQGQKFDRTKANNYSVIRYNTYPTKLSRPSQGYRWVRSGDDAYLIRISNNMVTKVVRDLF